MAHARSAHHPSPELGFFQQIKNLPWPFWVANIMEMIERLAYYGVRVVIPIYIAQADEPGGLHFTQVQKGQIFAYWALVQSGLPVFTGGFADRYGYKNQIVVAILLKIVGYVMMATQRDYWMFFLGCMTLAAGTAVFKPPIQGTFVRQLNSSNSGVGWGLFYMVVNVGGFLGPPLAHFLYGYSWPTVFYGCAVIVSLNLLWLLTYKDVDSGADKTTGALDVAWLTFRNILNARLIAFILIMSLFWAMFHQLFDLLPNFIVDWVDSSSLAGHLPEMFQARNSDRAPQLTQEWIINLNPLLILLLVVPLSWLVNAHMRRLSSILLGILISSVGILVAGFSMSIYFCLLGIFCFSVGEMLASPKMNEYLGVIAPNDKKALYMGYANIPGGIGWYFGSLFAGHLYEAEGEKAGLAVKYLAEKLGTSGVERNAALKVLMEKTGWSAQEATNQLWALYDPWTVWIPFVVGGVLSALLIAVFNQFAKKWEDVNA